MWTSESLHCQSVPPSGLCVLISVSAHPSAHGGGQVCRVSLGSKIQKWPSFAYLSKEGLHASWDQATGISMVEMKAEARKEQVFPAVHSVGPCGGRAASADSCSHLSAIKETMSICS